MVGVKLSIPVYEAVLNDEDPKQGVKAISFVEVPAIQSEGIALSAVDKHVELKLAADPKKYTFTAPVLIPNKKIYREDEPGKPYYLVFNDEQVEKLMIKFMKEKNTDQTNTNHDGNMTNDNFVIECFQLKNEAMIQGMIDIGLKDRLPVNTWMITYKMKDMDTYNAMLSNKLNGLSVEAFVGLQLRQLSVQKPEIIVEKPENKKLMKSQKIKTFLSDLGAQITALLLEEDAPLKYILEDGSIIETDASGKILSPENVADGDYKLAPDQEYSSITVKEGSITDKKKEGAAPAPAAPAEQQAAADPAKKEEAPAPKAEEKPAAPASGSTEPAPAAPAVEQKKEEPKKVKYALADAKTADGKILSLDEATGIVSIVAEDGSKSPAPEGEYKLEDGSVVVIDAQSMIVEIIPVAAAAQITALSASINDLNGKLVAMEKELKEAKLKLSNTPATPNPKAPKKVDDVDPSKMTTAQRMALAAKLRIKEKSMGV